MFVHVHFPESVEMSIDAELIASRSGECDSAR